MFNLKHENTNFTCTPTILNNKNNKSLGYICESNNLIEGFQNENKSISIKNISGLTGWFDSKDPNLTGEVPIDNTVIRIWKDKSDSKNDFLGKAPGKWLNNGIKFTNSWYQSIKPYTYPIDVYVVIKLDRLNKHADVIGFTEKNKDNFNSLTYSEYKAGYWHNGSTYFTRTRNSVANLPETSTDIIIMGWSIGNNNFKIYRNGVQIMSTNSYQWNVINPYLQLGNRLFIPTEGLLNGTIYEVIVYNRQINDGERKTVFKYLTNKWLLPPPKNSKVIPEIEVVLPPPQITTVIPEIEVVLPPPKITTVIPEIEVVLPPSKITTIVPENEEALPLQIKEDELVRLKISELLLQKNLKKIIEILINALTKPNINNQLEILLKIMDENLNKVKRSVEFQNYNRNPDINPDINTSISNSIQNVVDNSILIVKSKQYKYIINDVKKLLNTNEYKRIMVNYEEILRNPEMNEIKQTINILLESNYSKIKTIIMSLISLFDYPQVKSEWIKLLIMLEQNLKEDSSLELNIQGLFIDIGNLFKTIDRNLYNSQYLSNVLRQPIISTLNNSGTLLKLHYKDFYRIIIENFIKSFIIMINNNYSQAIDKISKNGYSFFN